MQQNNTINPSAFERNIASQLWFKYFPYWPLFLIFLVVAGAGAWFYLRYKAPLYESTASILIKDEKKGNDDSKVIASLNQLSTKKIIENEIEVIRSRSIMGEVVKSLHLYAPVFEKGKVIDISAYAASPVSIEAMYSDSIKEVNKVYFTIDHDAGKIRFNGSSYPMNEWVSTDYGVLRFKSRFSQDTSNKTEFFFSLRNPKEVTLSLLSSLKVNPASKLSSVITLKLKDEVPKRAEDILNGLLVAYNKASVKDKNNLASNTLSFLDERLDLVTSDLNSIENKLQQYKSSRGAIDISSQGQLFLENVSQNDQRLSDVSLQLTVLDQVEKYVKSKDNAEGIVPSTMGVSDPMLSQLLDKLYESELQYEKLRKTTAQNNPVLMQVTDQINKIKPSILENISNQKRSLEANKNNLYSTNNRYSSMLRSIPQKERDLVEISREHSIKKGIYNFLLERREETALSLSASVADSRVIDRAESTLGPVSPNKPLIYAIAAALAILLCIGLIVANEITNPTILYRQEIEACTTKPIIGEIAYEKTKNQLVIGDGKKTFVAEQFRKLRTALPYIGIRGDRKKLLVTSTVPGDGKSFVVANLGMSLALTGKKVVLLEFDLSNPALSEKLEMPETSKGLTEYLSGNAEPEEIIRRTQVNQNLFVISAGEIPENPSELIVSGQIQELLHYLTPLFDYIIIDTAPVGLLSDAYVLSAHTDGTLYVIRHRHTPKLSIQRIDKTNEINELKNMGIVFNGVKARGFAKNGYGYGFGYGYIHKEKTGRNKRKLKKVSHI